MTTTIRLCLTALHGQCRRNHRSEALRCFASVTSDSGENDKLSMQGRLKNPIIHQLWTDLHQVKKKKNETKQASQLKETKTPSQSEVSVTYPFSKDTFFMETYRNPFGQMRFGKILEDIDALAGNVAFYHASTESEANYPMVVTASVDRISLKRLPLIEMDQHLSGKVTYVGNSSMEIRLQCVDDSGCCWLEAFLTFVTLDSETFLPRKNPPLQPQTPLEQEYFQEGKRRAFLKKQARQSKDPVQMAELDERASELLDGAGLLIHMPSLADHSSSILVDDTRASNMEVAQPQVQNYHGRIFGGFLMRRAYELAFADVYMFAGRLPIFLEVDEVSFESPVDVGDLIVFNSQVLYVEDVNGDKYSLNEHGERRTIVHVEVDTWVTDPERKQAKVSNQFYFSFALPKGATCRQVFPSSIDQARRIALRKTADAANL